VAFAVFLCQATLVMASSLPSGCTANGTVLVSCAGFTSSSNLGLSWRELTAIAPGAFDDVPATITVLYVIWLRCRLVMTACTRTSWQPPIGAAGAADSSLLTRCQVTSGTQGFAPQALWLS